MPPEVEYVPAPDEGTPDGLKTGESTKRIGAATITKTVYSLLSPEDIVEKIRRGLQEKVSSRNKSRDNIDLDNMPDNIIKTIELHDDGKITFKINDGEYGTKIDLGDREVKEKISQTYRCALFLGGIADILIYLYNKVIKNEFTNIVKENEKREEIKKNFKPVLPPGMADAISKERTKMLEKKKAALGLKEEPPKKEEVHRDKWKDWDF